MSNSSVDSVRHERLEANARYNRALTALDRAIVDCGKRALTHEDFDRLSTALIVFLQQITAFVDTNDRTVAAEAAERFERVELAIARTDELRTQLNVVQRALRALERHLESFESSAPPTTRADTQPTIDRRTLFGSVPLQPDESSRSVRRPPNQSTSSDYRYLAFEDEFRGSPESVNARLRQYLPIFAGRTDIVDLGCGRGELLTALREAGVPAVGVDANADMVAAARERGLHVIHGDALEYLSFLPDETVGGIVATQMIEHLEPANLVRLVDLAGRKLRPGAPIVLETINPACWLAFFSSYMRDLTHVRPIHPETLQYLLRASRFEHVELKYSAPVPDHVKMKTIDLPDGVESSSDPCAVAITRVAHAVNANAVVLNNLMFTHMDYAAVAYRTNF
jgi:SAM-dependent methyltransferase